MLSPLTTEHVCTAPSAVNGSVTTYQIQVDGTPLRCLLAPVVTEVVPRGRSPGGWWRGPSSPKPCGFPVTRLGVGLLTPILLSTRSACSIPGLTAFFNLENPSCCLFKFPSSPGPSLSSSRARVRPTGSLSVASPWLWLIFPMFLSSVFGRVFLHYLPIH